MAAIIPSSLPEFTYTGSYTTELRPDWGWVIRFTSRGLLTFAKDQKIDVYILGGGGGGGGSDASPGGGGGGGYQTIKFNIAAMAGVEYLIEVGPGGPRAFLNSKGGTSSAFGYSASGGDGGGHGDSKSTYASGGSGGTGNGGSRGYAGGSNSVREFGEDSTWPIYGGGGGAGGEDGGYPYGNAKGYGGGGQGADNDDEHKDAGGAGYQGIVSIRNTEVLELPVKFNGTTLLKMFFNGNEVKSLIFNGTTIFMENMRRWLICLKSMVARFRSAPETQVSFALRLKDQT